MVAAPHDPLTRPERRALSAILVLDNLLKTVSHELLVTLVAGDETSADMPTQQLDAVVEAAEELEELIVDAFQGSVPGRGDRMRQLLRTSRAEVEDHLTHALACEYYPRERERP